MRKLKACFMKILTNDLMMMIHTVPKVAASKAPITTYDKVIC